MATILMCSPVLAEQDAAARGERDFRACMPCHSLEPDRNMTGPSLAGVWGRKADSGNDGPQSGAPALVPAGMMGDRADVIFAAPAEISKTIEPRC
ncbi:hypothetical protein [Bradyrhizobium sp. 142]|uniref:c-type cytochrome n=1 Tax=Bradyrhizobium sp. 142 TaxID=2782618 RepID=UPI00320AFEED